MQYNMYPAQLQYIFDLIKVLKPPIKESGGAGGGKGTERWMDRQCSILYMGITLNLNKTYCDCFMVSGLSDGEK